MGPASPCIVPLLVRSTPSQLSTQLALPAPPQAARRTDKASDIPLLDRAVQAVQKVVAPLLPGQVSAAACSAPCSVLPAGLRAGRDQPFVPCCPQRCSPLPGNAACVHLAGRLHPACSTHALPVPSSPHTWGTLTMAPLPTRCAPTTAPTWAGWSG